MTCICIYLTCFIGQGGPEVVASQRLAAQNKSSQRLVKDLSVRDPPYEEACCRALGQRRPRGKRTIIVRINISMIMFLISCIIIMISIYIYIYIYIYIVICDYIYIYIYICICVYTYASVGRGVGAAQVGCS